MKNHKVVNGSLLQIDKKWSALTEQQRTWIFEILKEEHVAYVTEYGKLPMKEKKLDVVDRVYARINERGIWIPYGEMKTNVGKMLDRLNRKSPLFVLPQKEPGK